MVKTALTTLVKNTLTELTSAYFSADLGAASGRLMVASLGPASIHLDEIYRFENHPIAIDNELYWDFPRLLNELKRGLRSGYEAMVKTALTTLPSARSLAIDTWGTDFGLVNEEGFLVAPPYSYREFTNQDMINRVRQSIPDQELYAMTGIQFIQVNTLFQLMAVKQRHPDRLEKARWLLMMPDLLNCYLTGKVQAEYTDASTTHFLNPITRTWETRIFDRLDLPARILPTLVQPGVVTGQLLPVHAKELGISQIEIKSCASHDTASAVAAIPAVDNQPWAFISSGTWLLVGVETTQPYLTPEALAANVTNEAGVNGTIRLLKNLTGLWLVQRLRSDLQAQGKAMVKTTLTTLVKTTLTTIDYASLVQAAQTALPFQRFIAPNSSLFHNPDNMQQAMSTFCTGTNQSVPASLGDYARCIFESLAYACADVIHSLEILTDQQFARVHVIGGGAQNPFLNACIANASGVDVYAGPVEATAIGNALVQAMADGIYPDLQSARRMVAASFPPEIYHPDDAFDWEKHRSIFHEVLFKAEKMM
jgi:rhamnulokinase